METLGLCRVTFEDNTDFKKIMDSIQQNGKLNKLTVQHFEFDEESYAKSLGKVLTNSRSVKEVDISNVEFTHPKSFYDVCSAFLNERCRLSTFKLRGITLTNLEAKIIQFIFMKNRSISTFDISHCKSNDSENFEYFF